MSDSGTRVRRRLPSHPSSAGEARRMVGRLLAEAGHQQLLEPAQLLVSEVVTNALVHSGTSIDVSMAATPDGVLVEVGDGSQHAPRARHYAPTASTGRGIALLERTADAWGVVPGIRGKTVWFQLSSTGSADTRPTDPPETPHAPVTLRPVAETIEVKLLNMPLLMHEAWQQYAEAALREYLLARLDFASDGDPFAPHAMATDALAVLSEHISRPDVGSDPDEVMSEAVDPRVSQPLVKLLVPAGSVRHFEVLDSMLDHAQELAEHEKFLLPTVQPEMRMMRRWLCDQVVGQAAGEAPVPWPPPDVPTAPELQTPPRRELAWDPTAVTGSPLAVIAADDMNLIVAVSAGALELLGYDDPDDLVGRRLVTIIPRRYRQAHLAGFTLHLLTGRSPLLHKTVAVPALRRDHTEVAVELHVESQRVAHGRSVFVATLREAASPLRR